MQPRREVHLRVQVAVVGRFEGVNVVVPVVSCDDNRQVVVLYEVPGDEGPCGSSVPVLEGVDLREAVVGPPGHQQRAVDVGMEAGVGRLAELDGGRAALRSWSQSTKGSISTHIARYFSLC